jgi:hypothetical protein
MVIFHLKVSNAASGFSAAVFRVAAELAMDSTAVSADSAAAVVAEASALASATQRL